MTFFYTYFIYIFNRLSFIGKILNFSMKIKILPKNSNPQKDFFGRTGNPGTEVLYNKYKWYGEPRLHPKTKNVENVQHTKKT